MWVTQPPAQISETLWMLGIHEYPLYLVKGPSEAALVEGGTGPMGPLVCEQLAELGVPAEQVRQLIVPHAHPDHVMAIPALRQAMPNLSVVASEAAAATLADEKAVAYFLKIDEAITAALIRGGVVDERHRGVPPAEPRIAVDRTIGEGDVVEVDGARYEVLSTPGHSDCSLSLFDPEQKTLLISDAAGYYMVEDDRWWPNYFTGYRAYLDSIERLAGLGAETLCLGHHGVVLGPDEVRAHLAAAAAATERYHGRILDEIKAGSPVRRIAEQLGAEAYEKTPWLPLDFFQKNCNVLIKQSLKHEGIEPKS